MNHAFFTKNVLHWYQQHRRDLPWRRSKDPYRIWISEVMLQQTRVAQALPYYKRLVKMYPGVRHLAAANEQDVLRLWQGLGYYSRARNMLACARQVVSEHGGQFPAGYDKLKRLKGIGDYTAAAVASIAFGEPRAVVDGNVYRVLARVFGLADDIATLAGKKKFAMLAQELIPPDDPGTYNQAIMEFGALHCTPTTPRCTECPLRKGCAAFQQEMVAVLPVKSKKAKARKRYFYYLVLRKRGKILVNQRAERDIWKGLYDFPLLASGKRMNLLSIRKHFDLPPGIVLTVSKPVRHLLTHQVLEIRFMEGDIGKFQAAFSHARWVTLSALARLPKPVPVVRFLTERMR